jgi:hypothetical protein
MCYYLGYEMSVAVTIVPSPRPALIDGGEPHSSTTNTAVNSSRPLAERAIPSAPLLHDPYSIKPQPISQLLRNGCCKSGHGCGRKHFPGIPYGGCRGLTNPMDTVSWKSKLRHQSRGRNEDNCPPWSKFSIRAIGFNCIPIVTFPS